MRTLSVFFMMREKQLHAQPHATNPPRYLPMDTQDHHAASNDTFIAARHRCVSGDRDKLGAITHICSIKDSILITLKTHPMFNVCRSSVFFSTQKASTACSVDGTCPRPTLKDSVLCRSGYDVTMPVCGQCGRRNVAAKRNHGDRPCESSVCKPP